MIDGFEQLVEELVQEVRVESVNPKNPVVVRSKPENWRCVGVGNSAAAFQPREYPQVAVKVYAPTHAHIAREEAGIYGQLGESSYFPRFYLGGENFIVIGYRAGVNIYDCLIQGIYIPEQVIFDVEEAMNYACSKGLNPSDVHSKNVIVHQGRGYLIDVSDYRRPMNCQRWIALKQAYYDYYQELYYPGMTVPSWILETIRKWYKNNEGEGDIDAFAQRIKSMFF